MFLAMIISQIVLSALMNNFHGYDAAVVGTGGFEVSGLIIAALIVLVVWTAAIVVSAIIWFAGWLLAYAGGWLVRTPVGSEAAYHSWAIMPAPVALARPQPVSVQSSASAPPL
jgi:hypothetical protein